MFVRACYLRACYLRARYLRARYMRGACACACAGVLFACALFETCGVYLVYLSGIEAKLVTVCAKLALPHQQLWVGVARLSALVTVGR